MCRFEFHLKHSDGPYANFPEINFQQFKIMISPGLSFRIDRFDDCVFLLEDGRICRGLNILKTDDDVFLVVQPCSVQIPLFHSAQDSKMFDCWDFIDEMEFINLKQVAAKMHVYSYNPELPTEHFVVKPLTHTLMWKNTLQH